MAEGTENVMGVVGLVLFKDLQVTVRMQIFNFSGQSTTMVEKPFESVLGCKLRSATTRCEIDKVMRMWEALSEVRFPLLFSLNR